MKIKMDVKVFTSMENYLWIKNKNYDKYCIFKNKF